jgi:hypothetical protein
LNGASHARQDEPGLVTGDRFPAPVHRHSEHVVRAERHTLLGGVDHSLGYGHRPIDCILRSGQRHRLAAEGDLYAALLGKLDEVCVVDAGKGQKISPLGGQTLADHLVSH